jgi:hypothetical protein
MDEDELNDRMSRRFESDDGSEDDSKSGMSSNSSQTSKSNRSSKKAQKAQNIKEEWNVRSFYLDDDLDSELTTAFKRLDLDLSEADSDIDLKKTRHFYPLIVELGIERLEEMERTEVTEQLESKDSV